MSSDGYIGEDDSHQGVTPSGTKLKVTNNTNRPAPPEEVVLLRGIRDGLRAR